MAQPETKNAWRGFKPGLWQRHANVRWFLQQKWEKLGIDYPLKETQPSSRATTDEPSPDFERHG